jgi:hypothetical protein
MGTYSLEHIIQEWGKGRLTEEQVIGQVLLIIREVKERLVIVDARLLRLEQVAKHESTPKAPRT